MYIAIITKNLGPTNRAGARIKARTAEHNPETGRPDAMTFSRDYSKNLPEDHAAAALALAHWLEWGGEWIGGATEDGYVFVRRSDRGPNFTV